MRDWKFFALAMGLGGVSGAVAMQATMPQPAANVENMLRESDITVAYDERLNEQRMRNELETLRRQLNELESRQVNAEMLATEQARARELALRKREELRPRPLPINEPSLADDVKTAEVLEPVRTPETATVDVGARTLEYWNALNSVIEQETAMRAPPAKLTAENALAFVGSRSRAARFAADAITAIPTTDVDPDVIALAIDLAAWYEDEFAISGNAQGLLASSDIAARKGAAGKSWKASEEQHRKDCDAINLRGKQLQSRMSKKYDSSFPPLK